MEAAYLLKPQPELVGKVYRHFRRLADFTANLCQQCNPECRGFMLTSSDSTYRGHKGPKLQWEYYGDSILMLVDGCDKPESEKAIVEFLAKDGFQVTPKPASSVN